MASYEPPSFSLGFDLCFDSEPQVFPEDRPIQTLAPNSVTHGSARVDEAFGSDVLDSDPEAGPEPPRILKRLRRGHTTATKTPLLQTPLDSPQSRCAGDDEIEEFSSQDGDFLRDAHPPLQHQSMCSSSKIPLHGCGVLATQSSTQRKRKQFSDNPASANLETSGNLSTLPKLTISPLRRFQLIDSDSDDSSNHDNVSREAHKAGPSSTEQQSNLDHSETLSGQKRKASLDMNKNEDLWKDFCPMNRIQTPALDEVCEEYFLSLKKSVTLKSKSSVCVNTNEVYPENTTSSRKDGQVWDTDDPVPPAHHYFFHDDPRVQKLVRDRLPNFSPLGVTKSRGNQQPNASVIDYMYLAFCFFYFYCFCFSSTLSCYIIVCTYCHFRRQFNHEAASKQRTCKNNVVKSSRGRNNSKISNAEEVLHPSGGWMDPKIVSSFSKGESSRQKAARKINVANRSTKGRNRSKKSNAEEVLHAPESWVNPKSSAGTPKDAGQRRVHANGQSAGHWYTTAEGRKAYVTKDGKELTGRTAYRHYRKESGAGFRKSKKKTSAKGKKRKG